MSKALRKTEALLREMVAVTLRNDLTRNQRTALETCITVHMHQKVWCAGPEPQLVSHPTCQHFESLASISCEILGTTLHAGPFENLMQEATEELVKKKIRDPSDFEWLKQSRFHWRADRDTVVTSICDVDFEYSYEYLGAQRPAS